MYGQSKAAPRNSMLLGTHFTEGGRTSILLGSFLGVTGSIVHPLLVLVGGFMVNEGGKLAG